MNTKELMKAMSEIDDKYVTETIQYKKKTHKPFWATRGTLAACLCLTLITIFSVSHFMRPSAIDNPPLQSGIPMPSLSNHPLNISGQDNATKQQAENIIMDEAMTLEEAQRSKPFGEYMLSAVPEGFYTETIKRYQDENTNYLFGLWTKGEGSFDEISWRVFFYDETMKNRLTHVADTQNYDLNLYSFPLTDSVPEELFEIVDRPIFSIDELTLEAVNRRAYSINEKNDTEKTRVSFSVRYKDIVVEISAKGVSPEWIYKQLIDLK